jgi:hypothetical protein
MARPIKGWKPIIQIFAIDVRHVGARPSIKISMSIQSHHYSVRHQTADTDWVHNSVVVIRNIYRGCPTRNRTRHFFNNFTTNKDIAKKFEADYRHTLQTHSFSFLTQRTYSCNIFIGVRIIKEMLGSVASGTRCIRYVKSQTSQGILS